MRRLVLKIQIFRHYVIVIVERNFRFSRLNTTFCEILSSFFKIEEFFVTLNTISFLFLKLMLYAVTTLGGKSLDFKVFQNSLDLFIFCVR